MLTLEQQRYIRKCCIEKGESISSVAKKTGHHWSTIKKYVEICDYNKPIKPKKVKNTKLDKVKEIIDKWLIEDKKLKPKQRHTAKRVYERLCNEYTEIFDASYRTVSDYVAKRKKEIYKETEGFLPLSHPQGEAQVDFGEADFIEKGNLVSGYFLSVSFPYSNAGYIQIFKGQNLECLLTGLKTVFEYIGKVPTVIWFDNLTPVVKGIQRNGRRRLSESFERFVLHYGFTCSFCNPGRGNEKGSVERKVAYFRKNFLVPIPQLDDIDEFNRYLLSKSDEDMDRHHYKKGEQIRELFEIDKNAMLPLSKTPYEIYRLEMVKADGYGKVTVDAMYTYSISPEYAAKRVWMKMTYNKVHILDEQFREIIVHDRLYGKKHESMDWIPYLSLMARRPNALKYTEFYSIMPGELRNYFLNCNYEEKRSGLRVLEKLLKETSMEKIIEIYSKAANSDCKDENALLNIYNSTVRDSCASSKPQANPKLSEEPPYDKYNSRKQKFLN